MSPFVYLPLLLMVATIALALFTGALFFLRRTGRGRANRLYGTWLILGGLTQVHFALEFTGWLLEHPALHFLPIYFSLWLPVSLFGYVKISLYPNYRLRWTDLKHLVLPIGQTCYFVVLWLAPDLRPAFGRQFWSPFYGALEQLLFLAGWPLYALFSVLYLRQWRAQHRRRSLPRLWWYLRKLTKGVLFFMVGYGVLAVADYVAFRYQWGNLRAQPWYSGAQAVSFTVLLLWLCVYGIQILVWGRRLRLHGG